MTAIMLPPERLPEGKAERHGALRDYFCDKDATASLTPAGWELALAWPDGDDRHIDPGLEAGLLWWGGGIRRKEMALAFRRNGRICRTLYDTWTLHSWSEWLARRGDAALKDLVILHVDDHRDLGSPRIIEDGKAWRDPITRNRCDLHDPTSVSSAIESGALGMGSFLTPFLHLAPGAEVRQLCQPPKAKTTIDYRFQLTTENDTLLAPGQARPSIVLDRSPGIGPGTYRITPNVRDWLDGIGKGSILLHIDMDYFNNRYDGDSDWPSRPEVLDPTAEEVRGKIDEMTNALAACGVMDRIEDVVIAYSPGFFPAELWSEADARLARRLKSINEH